MNPLRTLFLLGSRWMLKSRGTVVGRERGPRLRLIDARAEAVLQANRQMSAR